VSNLAWLPQIVGDLEQLDPKTRKSLLDRAVELLNSPELGESVGQDDFNIDGIKRIKLGLGYWAIYFYGNECTVVAAILPCEREITKGSRVAATRIVQIRQKTEREKAELERLLAN